jgi:hypothetical protein
MSHQDRSEHEAQKEGMRTNMSGRVLLIGGLAVILLVILFFAWGGFGVGTEPGGQTDADIEENAPVDGEPDTAVGADEQAAPMDAEPDTATGGGDEIEPGESTAAPEPSGPEDGAETTPQ